MDHEGLVVETGQEARRSAHGPFTCSPLLHTPRPDSFAPCPAGHSQTRPWLPTMDYMIRSSSPTTTRPKAFMVHRAWWVALGAFLAIVAAGAFATMAGLLVDPLTREFQWSRGTIGLAVSVNMVLYGLTAPFAAALMDRFGLRHVVAGALAILAVGAALTTTMTQVWQFALYWGVLTGLGTGSMALTFAATVTNRWFVRRRGLASGLLSSASVLGQFLFLPALGWVIERYQWRPALVTLMLFAVIVAPLV